ncbi:putative mitochondrial protein fmp25 [Phaeomoniella chlamydospora]|uniref:Putative mitochondrial protein fmp25 n=1 Tax=Phaeomoniella chlamydospora TaxID=158046 RepID=A0A0G2DY34_PHACM|nr:putative mitochondrial protein fmp25 [Phaeomoniella chlamydospora]
MLAVPAIGIFALSEVYRGKYTVVSLEAPPPQRPEVVLEGSKKRKGASKEEIRDLISSQHLQVKKSWENPGVYAWGSNTGKVVAPDSNEAIIKTPRRIPFFDDLLLRDLKLDRNFGAAITETGDLLQWGRAYSEDETQPSTTLKGKDLVSLAISRDRVLALSKSGEVYSIPVSKVEQIDGYKPLEDSWVPFWKGKASITYRLLQPEKLGFGERVTAITAGLDHALLLTNSGRVFSTASSSESYPSAGQLGVPGLTWATRPRGDIDMCHEIGTLKGFDAKSVAAGDYHSLVLDKEGRLFSFGDNTSGQLGFETGPETACIDAPSLVPISRLYQGASQAPRVTSIAAGGLNTFFTVDATRVLGPGEDPKGARGIGRITADTWACGQGIKGTLGNGRWTHVQGPPAKVPLLSGLFEYDETENATIPIRLANISVGSTHVSATMANLTYLGATDRSSENDTNWGADAVLWGCNEHYQLGTGKRNNVNAPIYIAPLDTDAEKAAGRDQKHRFHITPRHKTKLSGRKVDMEQKIECGRHVTAVYSAV